jgi:hypothetical protein
VLPIALTQLVGQDLVLAEGFLLSDSFVHFHVSNVKLFAGDALGQQLATERAPRVEVGYAELIAALGTKTSVSNHSNTLAPF